jgi:hypothetical protein
MFGGPTPDALAALVAMLATLLDNRGTPQSEVSTTPRAGTVSCIRLSNSEATPAYSMGCRWSATAASTTCSGPGQP